MVQTRGQERQSQGTKRKSVDSTGKPEAGHNVAKRAHKETDAKSTVKTEKDYKSTVDSLLTKCGGPPLGGLDAEKLPPSDIVMAHILNALLSSTRISHNIARSTLDVLLDSKYNDLKTLHNTSWDERTEALTKGGYTRYRERMANFLGDLLNLMEEKYDDDAGKMLPEEKKGDDARDQLAARLREIKGLGPVEVDIVMGGLQSYFTNISPFLDHRSRKTAEKVGLGDDIDRMYGAVGSDPGNMARLEVALTEARLGKREGEFVAVT